ncbi:NUDIX domain-containing protein [Patescibacteria group bacterium]|nr:NUDIX domain-containing protein [Patescibacteria group bacterium]
MIIRRCSGIALRDKDGKVLLQHRTSDAPSDPNCWTFFGGTIEGGETPEEAARREAKEELGIELKNLKFFKKYRFSLKNKISELVIFTAPLTISIEQLRKQQKEGQGLGLFSLEELKKLKIADHIMAILKDLFNR